MRSVVSSVRQLRSPGLQLSWSLQLSDISHLWTAETSGETNALKSVVVRFLLPCGLLANSCLEVFSWEVSPTCEQLSSSSAVKITCHLRTSMTPCQKTAVLKFGIVRSLSHTVDSCGTELFWLLQILPTRTFLQTSVPSTPVLQLSDLAYLRTAVTSWQKAPEEDRGLQGNSCLKCYQCRVKPEKKRN